MAVVGVCVVGVAVDVDGGVGVDDEVVVGVTVGGGVDNVVIVVDDVVVDSW